jgi:LysR family transcriptional regulator, mexEF-oprN operon transcriptional activator
MNENNFHGVDLNALIVFAVLMRERSVTKAAEKLFLGQPAVSHALNRLREKFNDRLFVRTRDGMVPTPRAMEIYKSLIPGLTQIEAAIRPIQVFDPTQSTAIMRFGIPDDLEIVLPELVKVMSEQAPKMRLVVRATDFRTVLTQIDSGDVQVALCAAALVPAAWHDVEVLKRESFAALYDAKLLGKRGSLSLKQYLLHPHILVSQNGELQGAVDEKLRSLGLSRNVIIAAARFTTLPMLLKQIPAIANVPLSSAQTYAQTFGLEISKLPFESPSFDLAMTIHTSLRGDAATGWFKAVIKNIIKF